MEIILTVLITLGVCTFLYMCLEVVKLNKRIQEIKDLRKVVEYQMRERETIQEDIYRRLDEWNSSTDRRFDGIWNKVHKLDSIINPNKDILKG